MSEHPRNFLVERQIPASTAAPGLEGRIGTEIEVRAGAGDPRQLVSIPAVAQILPPKGMLRRFAAFSFRWLSPWC